MKAIFFDIDGTLIDTLNGVTQISSRVKRAIRQLQDEGNFVFIATGRPYSFLDEEIRNFGFDGYVLVNGAQVIVRDQVVYNQAMDKRFVKMFADILDDKGIQYVLVGERNSYLDKKSQEFYEFYESIHIPRSYFESEYRLEDLEVYKFEIFGKTSEVIEECKEWLKNYEEYGFFHSIHPSHLEVYYKENHKATGILKALEYLNLPIEESYAFGDGENDIEMLATVGCGIAMGNAAENVKRHAKQVTDSVSQDGVARGIGKYILCQKNDEYL